MTEYVRDAVGRFEEKVQTSPDVTLPVATSSDEVRELIGRYDAALLAFALNGEDGYEDYEDERLQLAHDFQTLLHDEPEGPIRDDLIKRFSANDRFSVEHIALPALTWNADAYPHWRDEQFELAGNAYDYFRAQQPSGEDRINDIVLDAAEMYSDDPETAFVAVAYEAGALGVGEPERLLTVERARAIGREIEAAYAHGDVTFSEGLKQAAARAQTKEPS